jgi:hypothetical protein
MGFFDTLARVGTAIVTGGTSELIGLVSPELRTKTGQLLFPTTLQQGLTTASLVALPAAYTAADVNFYKAAGYVFDPKAKAFIDPVSQRLKQQALQAPAPIPQPSNLTGASMGFDLGGLLSSVSNIFGGNQNPVFNAVSQGAQVAQNFLPTPSYGNTYGIAPQPVAARAPQVMAPALRSIGTVGRGFFNKYPNLATAIQALRNQGRNVKRSQLYSMLKRFGPDLLISGGILTAAAVSELMVAGPGRRRMNPANAKALRRAAGRIRSFHKLCTHTDLLKTRGRRSSNSRCGTCKRSPCRC